jgi:hypothetical protein
MSSIDCQSHVRSEVFRVYEDWDPSGFGIIPDRKRYLMQQLIVLRFAYLSSDYRIRIKNLSTHKKINQSDQFGSTKAIVVFTTSTRVFTQRLF